MSMCCAPLLTSFCHSSDSHQLPLLLLIEVACACFVFNLASASHSFMKCLSCCQKAQRPSSLLLSLLWIFFIERLGCGLLQDQAFHSSFWQVIFFFPSFETKFTDNRCGSWIINFIAQQFSSNSTFEVLVIWSFSLTIYSKLNNAVYTGKYCCCF